MKTLLSITFFFFLISSANAELTANNVAVLANSNSQDSLKVAKSYLAARNIPESHLIALPLTQDDTISREDYENKVIAPLRKELETKAIAAEIKVIVTVYGVPLKLASPVIGPEEKAAAAMSQEEKAKARIVIEENISKAQIIAGEKPNGFIEIAETEIPKEFEALVNRASKKLSTLKDQELQTKQNELAQVLTDMGGLSSLVGILQPAGNAEQIAKSTKEIEAMKAEVNKGIADIGELQKSTKKEDTEKLYVTTKRILGAIGVAGIATALSTRTTYTDADAAFDSELSLLWWDRNSYPITGALPNPYSNKIFSQALIDSLRLPVIMVSRIDGPSVETSLAMISSTLEAEKTGLKGNIYIDTRGIKSNDREALTMWDKGMKDLGWFLRDNSEQKVSIDIFPELIEEAKDTAIYAGWYQLRKFEGDFTFKPGAIAWHIASEEAVNIHNKDEKGWCKNFLERGASVTIGAVAEPYLESFPVPLEFFGLLLSGRYTLIEAYYLTTRNISWRVTLFGDPLYRPYKENKKIKFEDLKFETGFPASPTSIPMKDPIKAMRALANQVVP